MKKQDLRWLQPYYSHPFETSPRATRVIICSQGIPSRITVSRINTRGNADLPVLFPDLLSDRRTGEYFPRLLLSICLFSSAVCSTPLDLRQQPLKRKFGRATWACGRQKIEGQDYDKN